MQSQDDDIIPRLWTAARTMFARMCAAVGEAAAIAARQTLSTADARAIRKWLSPLEAMARKIVIVEALSLIEARGDTHARAAFANAPTDQGMRVCHPDHPALPAVTLIALRPQPVRILTRIDPPPPRALLARARAPSLRLWPCARANAGPHARDVGPNLSVRDVQRDRARLMAARRMQSARTMRRSEHERLARRIEALARILDKPLRAARRLARKLVAEPLLAIKLAVRRPPRTKLGPEPEYTISHERAVNAAYDFGIKHSDSS